MSDVIIIPRYRVGDTVVIQMSDARLFGEVVYVSTKVSDLDPTVYYGVRLESEPDKVQVVSEEKLIQNDLDCTLYKVGEEVIVSATDENGLPTPFTFVIAGMQRMEWMEEDGRILYQINYFADPDFEGAYYTEDEIQGVVDDVSRDANRIVS